MLKDTYDIRWVYVTYRAEEWIRLYLLCSFILSSLTLVRVNGHVSASLSCE